MLKPRDAIMVLKICLRYVCLRYLSCLVKLDYLQCKLANKVQNRCVSLFKQ